MKAQSSKWLFNQTPQFTMSSHANEEDDRERPPLPDYFPQQVSTEVVPPDSFKSTISGFNY